MRSDSSWNWPARIPLRQRAYYQAARSIGGLDGDLAALAAAGRLGEIPGLGPALREKVAVLAATGRLQYHEDLRAQVPPGLIAMLRVPGLGPKKIRTLHHGLGIVNLAELETACREHRLQQLPGFGAKTELRILAGLEWLARNRGRHLWHEAAAEAAALLDALRADAMVAEADVAGSIRRLREVVKDINLVAATDAPHRVAERFAGLPGVDEVAAMGGTRVAVRLKSGIDADLRLVAPGRFAPALLHFTGSREHNAALRAIAKERGLELNEDGLFRGDELLPCASEEEIHRALGLCYIPPELREDLGELEAAAAGTLPDLVAVEGIRGALHVHTAASDGAATLAEMAHAAAALGWEYLGIADHSQSAAYAGGLRPDALQKQRDAIEAHNRAGGRPYLLFGIEAEIKPDGALDYPEEILARFDYVVASVHSHFGLDREAMTARVIGALHNPYVTVLGHPTGRLLLEREGYAVDLEAVLAAAAEEGVAVEINASPYRLDLDWRWCMRFRDKLRFWINPDAHGTAELGNLPYGINTARKGWLTPDRVLNTWSLADVRHLWRKQREKAQTR